MNRLIPVFSMTAFLLIFSCGRNSSNDRDTTGTIPKLEIRSDVDSLLFIPAEDPGRGISESLKDNKVIAYRYVTPNIPIDKIVNLEKDSRFKISLARDLVVTAKVQRIQEILELTSLSATVLSPAEGHVTLTVENKNLRGSVTLYNPSRYFQIRYHSDAEAHYIAELDWKKMDILPGSLPVNPPD